jgi:hypothetical protein
MAALRLVPAQGSPIEIIKDRVLIGRDPSVDVVLADGSVSRKHAVIEKRGDAWAVVDQASANGTFLEGQRIGDSGLRNGQELRFGTVVFKVEIEESVADLAATIASAPLPPSPVLQTKPIPPPPPKPIPPPPPAAAPLLPKPTPPPPPVRPPVPPAPAGGARPPAPASSPVRPMTAPPAAPKKGRGPFFWIGTGCCGCLLLVIAVGAGIAGFFYFMSKGAVDAVGAQLKDLKQGRMSEAYDRLSRSYKDRLSPEDFQRLVAAHPGLGANQDFSVRNRSVDNNKAKLSGVLTSTSGSPEPVTFELEKEGGAWKISSIQFEGDSSLWRMPLSPAFEAT